MNQLFGNSDQISTYIDNVAAGTGGNNTTKIVIITVSSVAVLAAILGYCFYRFWKKGRSEGRYTITFLTATSL